MILNNGAAMEDMSIIFGEFISEFGREKYDKINYVMADAAMRYDSNNRAYHNMHHIIDCFLRYSAVKDMVIHRKEFIISMLSHDIVYRSGASDNETRSADIACIYARILGLKKDSLEKSSSIIMATEKSSSPQTIEEMLMSDIDKSILGSEKEAYDRYRKNIYAEYESIVPHDIFIGGRKKFLEDMLSKEISSGIYYTDHFRRYYAQNAKYNISQELKTLLKSSVSS